MAGGDSNRTTHASGGPVSLVVAMHVVVGNDGNSFHPPPSPPQEFKESVSTSSLSLVVPVQLH